MSSFLTSVPPVSLKVCGVDYPIDSDYRAILRYSTALQEAGEDIRQITACMGLVYETLPDDIEAASEQLNWFVECGKEEKRRRPSNKILGINANKPFDFEVDGELIYSAFRRNDVYGIDLLTIPYLHWWNFMALLNDIPDDTRLSRVMEYRITDTGNKKLSKEQRDLYAAMQRYYRIRKDEKLQRNEELIQALIEGRDPAPYLMGGE